MEKKGLLGCKNISKASNRLYSDSMCFLRVSRQLPPKKIAPQLGLGFSLRLVLEFGSGGNFSRGQLY